MKKKSLAFFAIAALAVIGCQKEDVKDLTPATITLQGIYNETLQAVKSDYEEVGDTYNFKWVSGDKFIAQSYNGADYDSPTLFTASAGDAAQVPFTGTPAAGYSLGDYAFYPNLNDGETYPSNNFVYLKNEITPISLEGTASDIASRVAAASATVQLCGTNIEDKDHPMAHIPMIGVKDINGDYSFTACTGVLKVTIKNFPTTATSVRLSYVKGDYPLNGTFVFDTNYEIKSSYAKSQYKIKYLNVTPSTSVEDRSFYFPLPTGTIAANSMIISVLDGANDWSLGLNSRAITITRGVVTELPAITYNAGVSVTMKGSADAPVVRFRFGANNSQFVVFKITEDTDVPSDLNNVEYGGRLGYPQSFTLPTNTSTYFPHNSKSGLKYLHYQIYDGDGTNSTTRAAATKSATSGYVSFYYLAPADKGNYVGTFTTTGDVNDSNKSIILGASNDVSKGNLMITSLFGRLYSTGNYGTGTPVYGLYSDGGTNITFTDGYSEQYFFYHNNHKFYICESNDDSITADQPLTNKSNLTLNISAGPTLTCTNKIVFYYDANLAFRWGAAGLSFTK